MISIAFFLGQLLAGTALAAVGLATGSLVDRALGLRMGPCLTLAVGLTLWGQVGVALGMLGILRVEVLLPLALATIALAGGLAASRFAGWFDVLRSAGPLTPAFACAIVLAFPLALAAFYPPLAFDETLYHLPFAQAFAGTGGLPFLADLRVPVFPALSEVLQAEVLLLAGGTGTHLVSLLAAFGTATLLVEWARWRGAPLAGWIAAGLFLGSPLVVYLSGTGLVEPLLGFLWAAALFAADRGRAGGSWRWAALAGFLAGSSASVKYLGLVAVLWVGVEMLAWADRRPRMLASMALGVVLGMALCYGRIVAWTGNPVFPLFSTVFGTSAWTSPPGSTPPFGFQAYGDWLTLPWDVIFDPDAVGDQPPLSPAWLLAAPLLVSAAARRPWAARALCMSLLFSLTVPLHSRYLLPLLPPLALAAGEEWTRWTRRWPRWTAVATAALLLLPGWSYALFHLHRLGPLPVTAEQRDRFWRRNLVLYPALSYLNRTHGSRYVAYGLDSENLKGLAQGRLIGEWSGPQRYDLFRPLLARPPALHAALRAAGAEYLILPRRADGMTGAEEWFAPAYSDAAATVYRLR